MKQLKSLFIGALVAVGLIAGCAKSSPSPGTGAELVGTISQALAPTYCEVMKSCLPRAELDTRFTREGLAKDCEKQWERNLAADMMAGLAPAIEAGRVKYDASELEACSAKLKSLGCAAFEESLFDICKETFVREAAAPAECRYDHECPANSRCETYQSCPGKCAPKSQANQPCRGTSDCAGGLACSAKTFSCTELIAEGGKCDASSSSSQCREGLYCAKETCTRLEHLYVRAEGDSCDDAQRCKEGLSCAGPFGSRTCQKPRNEGEVCQSGFPAHCAAGLFCAMERGASEGKCSKLKTSGQECGSPDECSPDLSCVQGACIFAQAPGSSCKADQECWSGSCKGNKCTELDPCMKNSLSANP